MESEIDLEQLGLSEGDRRMADLKVPDRSEAPETRESRFSEYIAGPSHVHTRDSEEGRGATHLIPELNEYLQDKIDGGTGKVELVVISDHSEHLAWRRSDSWYDARGFSAEEVGQVREAEKIMAGGAQQVELPKAMQDTLMRAQSAVLDEQVSEIAEMNAQTGRQIRIFSGTETSIMRKDGAMTLPDSTLSKLDVVTASIHPDFITDERGNRERIYTNTPEGLVSFYLQALENPNIDILGHPIKANMKEVISSMQEIISQEGGLDRVLGPLMKTMAEKKVAFEINMKDPLIGLNVREFIHRSDSNLPTIFEEVIRLAQKYGTPLAIGSDFHLLRDWQDGERIAESLPEEDRDKIAWSDMDAEGRQRSEATRRRFGPGVRFWLRLARIGKTLEKYDIAPDQVVNSSRTNMEKWLESKKSNSEAS